MSIGWSQVLCDSHCGSVFKVTPGGNLTILHTFNGQDGNYPSGQLLQATDGNFYGTTFEGGAYSEGTVFKMTPSGTLTSLYSFCPQYNCPDGANPLSGVIQATDGTLYGTTAGGGVYGCTTCGTIFKITPSGSLTTLFSFNDTSNGGSPGGLLQATNGNFYGLTSGGGTNYYGTFFQFFTGKTLSVSTSGNGTVTSTDGFINCPGTCTHIYPDNTQVTLNAAPGQEWVFGGWSGACSGTGSCIVTMTQPLSVDAIFSEPLQFVAVIPCRLVDTRPQYGGGDPIQGGTHQDFPISGAPNCGIPTSAAAYSLNVTVVPQGYLGFLTIWPAGQQRPGTSTLNSLDGRIKANAAIIPAGTSGDVSVYVTQTANVILDIDGYFAPASGSTLVFYPLPPCRVADTRKDTFPPGLGSPYLTGRQERPFPMLNATACNIPSSAAAYSLNFTVVPHGPLGYLTVWPTGQARPNVSTLNDVPGQNIANAAIVVAGAGGEVSVYPTDDTDLVIDINGYFALGTGGLSLYPAAPCRVIDTRKVGGGLPFSVTLSPPVDVLNSPCEPPATAQAYVFSATVVPQGALSYLTLWPDGTDRPLVSTLNAQDGSISSNMAIVPSTNGKVDAFAAGLTQLILDISSYFAP